MRLSSDEKELLNVIFCLMSLLEAFTASMFYMVLLDVIKKGHSEPNKKIGSEILPLPENMKMKSDVTKRFSGNEGRNKGGGCRGGGRGRGWVGKSRRGGRDCRHVISLLLSKIWLAELNQLQPVHHRLKFQLYFAALLICDYWLQHYTKLSKLEQNWMRWIVTCSSYGVYLNTLQSISRAYGLSKLDVECNFPSILSVQMQKLTAAVSNLVLARSLQGTFDMTTLTRIFLIAFKLDHLVKDEHQVIDEVIVPNSFINPVRTPKTNNEALKPLMVTDSQDKTLVHCVAKVFEEMCDLNSCVLNKALPPVNSYTHNELLSAHNMSDELPVPTFIIEMAQASLRVDHETASDVVVDENSVQLPSQTLQ
ncbi:hypothetical protein KSS87_003120, partial [Heliosperma pusillum]